MIFDIRDRLVHTFSHSEIARFVPRMALEYIIPRPKWLYDLEAGLTEAKADNRIVILVVAGAECPHCDALDHEIFNSPIFWEWVSLHKPVLVAHEVAKADPAPESPPKNNTLLTKYHVKAFPTVIVLNSTGSERGRLVGYSALEDVRDWLVDLENVAKLNSTPV